jgi:hypothetical protein
MNKEPLTRLNLTSFDFATLSHKGRGFLRAIRSDCSASYKLSMNVRSRGAHFAQSRPEAVWP